MIGSSGENTKQLSEISIDRDGYVDFCKGLLILWVIHIHTVFWSGRSYITEDVRQASLLIDVTTFFFISGYLTKPGNFVQAFRRSLKQFKNLYFNYLAISLLLLAPLSMAYFLRKNLIPDFQQAIIFMLSVLRLEAGGDVWGVIPVYRGSFWYLWVYFSLLFIIPVLIACFKSQRLGVIILASLLLLLYASREWDWNFSFLLTEAVYIYFYAFIYLLGMAYRLDGQLVPTRYLKLSFLINILICLVVFFMVDHQTLSLHAEKFPPSFKYLAYSLLLIHIFVIVQRTWRYPNSKHRYKIFPFLEWCGRNSYFIYLFQGVVWSVPLYLTGLLLKHFSASGTYFIFLVFNVVFTLVSTFFYLRAKLSFLEFMKARRIKQA